MARIRAIKPGFFRHGDLFDAEKASGLPLRVAYAGLWCVADREGRFKWKPRDMKPEILPFDDVDMADVLEGLRAKGLVHKYSVDGQEYGCIPSFLVHQHVNKHEAKSTIPEPPKNKNARAKKVRAPDAHPQERKGREGNDTIGASAPFDDFWKVYPKREARGAAIKAFAKASEKTTPEVLIEAAKTFAAKRAGQDKQFTKQPATWLNQECWLDDGIAPAPEPDAVAVETASTAWGGRAAPLVAEIGPTKFQAWFGEAEFEDGPPARIRFSKPFQRTWVAGHFGSELRRAYGEIELAAA